LEFNVPFQHKYGYIRDELSRVHLALFAYMHFAMKFIIFIFNSEVSFNV